MLRLNRGGGQLHVVYFFHHQRAENMKFRAEMVDWKARDHLDFNVVKCCFCTFS